MSRKYHWLHDPNVEKDILMGIDISSRDELLELEKEEFGGIGKCINWELWDKLVQENREKFKNMTFKPKEELIRCKLKPIYVYNYDGQQIGHYKSADEAEKYTGVRKCTIQQMAWNKKPYQTERLFFSYKPITMEDVKEAVKKYAHKYITKLPNKAVDKWVYDLQGNLLGHFNSTAEVAEKYNIQPKAVNYYAHIEKPYKKHKLIILNKPINETKSRSMDL